jgi:o-succinylbenzoate---CoA ligase
MEHGLIRLLGPSFLLEEDKTRQLVIQLARRFPRSKTIGLYLDISPNSVTLLLAAITLGLRVAICPLREPPMVLNKWLKGLGVKTVLSSCPTVLGIDARWFQVSDLLVKNAQCMLPSQKDFISIVRTSGTTAEPKNAVISDAAHKASAQAVNQYFDVNHESIFLLSLPLYHVSGLSIVYRSLLSGASIYIAQDYNDLIQGIKAHQITHLSLVPAQLKRLLDDGIDLAGLTAVIIGGDALPKNLCERALALYVPIYATYGLTETASMIWVHNCRTNQAHILPHARLTLASDGEVLVGGASLFSGYLDACGSTICNAQDGLFATGDVVADFAQLQLIVRKNNRIISGGENIQAEEVEHALESHPSIASSVVVGVNDTHFGMRAVAYIKWVGPPSTAQELQDYLKPHLAPYKWPKAFLPWPEDAPNTLKKPRGWFASKALLTNLS